MRKRDEFRCRPVTVTTRARRVVAVALGMVAILWLGVGCASRSAPSPKPNIYPERAHPEADVDRAIAEARQSDRRVLLNFGASWCSDSQSMFRLLTEDPVIAPLVRERFVLVMIDVGERHGELWDAPIVRKYGSPFSRRGIPALVILDADGRQLTDASNHPLRDRDHRRPGKVERFLRAWAGPRPSTTQFISKSPGPSANADEWPRASSEHRRSSSPKTAALSGNPPRECGCQRSAKETGDSG